MYSIQKLLFCNERSNGIPTILTDSNMTMFYVINYIGNKINIGRMGATKRGQKKTTSPDSLVNECSGVWAELFSDII